MASVTICSDFGAPLKEKINSDTVFTVSPSISHEVDNIPLFGYITVYLLIHLLKGFFIAPSLAIMSKAVIKICVKGFVLT